MPVVTVVEVLLLGLAKSQATRKAQRFFAERRVPVAFHDLRKRAPTPGQLRRWVERFGVDGVMDRSSKTYVEGGFSYVHASDEDWLQRLAAEPGLLRLPLARAGTDLAVGDDVEGWLRLAAAVKG
jgi:arsenate reductase-like glutaredoxin family protein